MADPRLLQNAVAIRMTLANPALTGRAGAPCPLVTCDDSPCTIRATQDRDALQARAAALRGSVLFVEPGATAESVAPRVAAAVQTGATPLAVAVPGEALYVQAATAPELERRRSALAGEPAAPAAADAPASDTRLRGRIALVTGSAQGFGKGIAEALARKGAAVVIADLNAALGAACADEINRACGEGSAMFAAMNVTDSASVRAGVEAGVRRFGGLDLFVANAGVLKAGGLDDMTEADFDLVTSVNYKAYFLGAKAVAPWMILQHRFNPQHFADIVQINSKSGLEGSKRNFAYAGSKFGALGLTQSFALELVPHNIKVNAICPGNYFDGPLWSDPERGLFVQYLRAGKVPGARTVEDVKQFYLSKVPMNRGCLPDDVAAAIFYLVEQTYETGQALPVTGGQVMLN